VYEPPETPLRFHAAFHQEWTKAYPASANLRGDNNYLVLAAEGTGHYVGTLLHVYNIYQVWWGEGDEMIFLDGEGFPPSMHGTGTEEYFDSAWCSFGKSPFAGAPSSNSLAKGFAGKTVLYRYHIADPIPFRKNIRFSLEHGRVTNDLDNLYASVALWYQAEPHQPISDPPPLAERFLDEKKMADRASEQALARTPWFLRLTFLLSMIALIMAAAALVILLTRTKLKKGQAK
jgi:hypothetical protein